VIREVSRKEYVERKLLMSIAFTLILIVTAILPFFFVFSLQHSFLQRANDTAAIILLNFRSYAVFVEAQWCARGLPRLLCLLALIAGAGAIAGEREAHTWPLVYRSAVPLRTIVFVKYGVLALWLAIVAAASVVVLGLHSLIAKLPFPTLDVAVTTFVAYATSLAFLALVFAASAFVSRTIFAAGIALAAGFAVAGILTLIGFNGTALGANLFGTDGAILGANLAKSLGACAVIAVAGLGLTVFEVDRRRAS
jgi:ABC-type transport system involved in multi-copper enzyme maturation permease subunit